MKTIKIILLVLLLGTGFSLIQCTSDKPEVCDCDQYLTSSKGDKITICHNGMTLEVSQDTFKEAEHGNTHSDGTSCYVGECSTLNTEEYEYDPCLEQCRKYEPRKIYYKRKN